MKNNANPVGTLHTPWLQAKQQHTQLLHPWLPPPNNTSPTIHVTTKHLIQAARRSRGKATGGDGWQSDHFLALPTAWWDCFRDLWHTIIHTASIPPSWLQTLVVLLPKPTGGTRPISITGIAWRIAASATVRAMAPWTTTGRLLHCAVGFLAGTVLRCMFVSSTTSWSTMPRTASSCHKASARLLIQSTSCRHTALSHHGAPDPLCQTILASYRGCRRLFLYNGAMTPIWQTTTHGILQGCPFSPLLLATLMNIWHHGIHTVAAPATTQHLDAWARELLPRVIAQSTVIDAILGFQENTSKTQLATPDVRLVPILDTLTPDNFPQGVTTSKLLGLVYNLHSQEVTTPTATVDKFFHRAKRIQQATRLFHHRRRLLRSTAVPCLTWAGPLASITPTQQRQLQLHAIHALQGWIPHTASRHNIWTAKLHPQDDPAYCLLEANLRLPIWYSRLQITTHPWLQHIRQWLQQPQHLQHIPALQNTFHTLQWSWHQHNHTLCKTDTSGRTRTLRLGWDGNIPLQQWLHHHWTYKLFRAEERVWATRRRNDPRVASLPTPPANHLPDMTAHKTAAHMPYTPTNTPERQVYMATGTSTWHTGKRHNIAPPRCLCQLETPSMPHLLWKCTALQAQRRNMAPRPPQNTSEERLLAAVAPPDPRPLHPTNQVIHAPHELRLILEQQLNQATSSGRPLVIATNGGAKHGTATWAVAVESGTFARPLRGEDHTVMMAELTAIWCALITLIDIAERPQLHCDLQVILAVDSQSAIDFLTRLSVPTQHFHLWHGFQQHRSRALELGLRIVFPVDPSSQQASRMATNIWLPHTFATLDSSRRQCCQCHAAEGTCLPSAMA